MADPRPPTTEAADRIPVSQKIAYALGGLVTNIAVNSVGQLSGLFFVIGLGISAVWVGYTQAFPRLLDAVLDPWIGALSDNCRSRFGRRIPFLFVGGLLIGVAFMALWAVPRGWSPHAMIAYLVVTSLLFYSVVSVYMVPYVALGLEMSPDYHEKTKLFAYAGFINNVSGFALPSIYYFANRKDLFHGDEVTGIRVICIGMAVLISVCGLTCALVCREPNKVRVSRQEPIPLFESLKATFKNKSFVQIIGAYFLLYVGFQLVMGFANFVVIYYLYDGLKDPASKLMLWNGYLWAVVGLVSVFPMTWMSQKFGKKTTVLFSFVLIVVGNTIKIVCYNQTLPWLNLIPTAMLSMGMVFAFSLVNSMIADICDEDELATGIRREGAYSAVYTWFNKVGVSVATVANGYILVMTHYNPNTQQQTAKTLFELRAWEIGLPSLLCVISIWILARYTLTEKRAYEIKAILEARRGHTPVAPAS